MESTSMRLKQIMKERGLKQVELFERCKPIADRMGVKMLESSISQYLSGRAKPSQSKLTILALALNVSEVWLMGYDVPKERTPQTKNTVPQVDGVAYRTLPQTVVHVDADPIDTVIEQLQRLKTQPQLTGEEQRLIHDFRTMTDKQKQKLKRMLDIIMEE